MNVILYSTHCRNCIVLEKKLKAKNIGYTEVNDIEIMTEKGFMQAPMLEVDGVVMNYSKANNWINSI